MENIEFNFDGTDYAIIKFGNSICPQINERVRSVCEYFESLSLKKNLSGAIVEWVPTYCTVCVYYNPLKISLAKIKKILYESVKFNGAAKGNSGTLHEIPVCYEDEFSPDMKNVCAHSGLSKEEVVAAHTSPVYTVYMLGFLPGFAYLGGMDERLETPRLEVPRVKIPAGSVAIGGRQTGVYPVDSPGGWQIIGRTNVKPYDVFRNPKILFRAGDKIKFRAVTKDEFALLEKQSVGEDSCGGECAKERYVATSGIKILSAGAGTFIETAGVRGLQKDGFNCGGAMDECAMILANIIAGNIPKAAVLESTLLGPEVEFNGECDFCITGADQNATLDGTPVALYTKVHAKAGSILALSAAVSGLRTYIAFAGGIIAPSVNKNFGGIKIKSGDCFATGNFFVPKEISVRSIPAVFAKCSARAGVVDIHVVKGAQFASFEGDSARAFLNAVYTVMPASNRMGCRLDGEHIQCRGGTDIISDAIPWGSVQITSAGLPIVMLSDRQTTGGYAKIATVIPSDLHLFAQFVPGTKIRFVLVSRKHALSLLKKTNRLLLGKYSEVHYV